MHLGATAGRCRVSGHLRMRMIFDGARRTLRWQRHTPEGGCRLMKGCIQACTAGVAAYPCSGVLFRRRRLGYSRSGSGTPIFGRWGMW